jgi:hypothetical protein
MNTTTRIGKIARLPHHLREQLNLRLHDHQPYKTILPWLNSLPEAKAIFAADFDNRPITKQNLSEWKQGGFRDWLLLYHASHFLQFLPSDVSRASSPASSTGVPPTEFSSPARAPESQPNILPLPKGEGRGEGEHDLRQPKPRDQDSASQTFHDFSNSTFCIPHSSLTAKLLLWTQLQYTTMARHIDAETDPDRKWTALRQFANDISRLRRSTLSDDYLQIQRDWLSLGQSNTADKKEKEFWKWTTRPDIEKKLFPDRRRGMTPEQLYQFEKDTCLMDGPGPEIAELMAEVRIAKKLLELRKVNEAEAKAKSEPDYDPNRPLPDTKVRLAGMPFEELFPTIPEKPLTETHPELDDDPGTDDSNDNNSNENDASPPGSAGRAATGEKEVGRGVPTAPRPAHNPSDPPALRSAFDEGGSDPVQPSPTKSNQIQPPSPIDPEPNSNNDNPIPDN